jgi:putative FmdB family regulatory protein
MPIYIYECTKCSHEFEVLQKIGEGNEDISCPECGKKKPKKLVAPFKTQFWSNFLDDMERKISPHKFK